MSLAHFKNIFTAVVPSSESAIIPALRRAGSLAQAAQRHVTVRVLGAKVSQPYSPLGGLAGEYVSSANAALQESVEKNARETERLLREFVDSVDCRALTASHEKLISEMVALGRISDLSIVNRASGVLNRASVLLKALLFETGRPVLVAPPQLREFRSRRIVIA